MRPPQRMAALMPAPRWLIAAAPATTIWSLSAYQFGPGSNAALARRLPRNLAWLAWLGATFSTPQAPMSRPLRFVRTVLLTTVSVACFPPAAPQPRDGKPGTRLLGT